MGKKKTQEGAEAKGFSPSDLEGIAETAAIKGLDSIFVAADGRFHWSEELAEAVFDEFEEVKIADLQSNPE